MNTKHLIGTYGESSPNGRGSIAHSDSSQGAQAHSVIESDRGNHFKIVEEKDNHGFHVTHDVRYS